MGDHIPQKLHPINRSDLLADTIVEQVARLIISNRLKPGDQLREGFLAEQLGVSRVPVREGLGKLERMGLIEKEPYRPAIVSSLSHDDIQQLYDVRMMIEPVAARRLAEARDPQAMQAIQAILDGMRSAAAKDDHNTFLELDLRLHESLVVLNGNVLLNEMWGLVSVRLRRFLWLKPYRSYGTLAWGVEIHLPICEAVLAGDGDAAERATRNHIVDVYRDWSASRSSEPVQGKR